MSQKRKEREEFVKNGILSGIEKGLNNKEIALQLNISMTILNYWMKKLKISNKKNKYIKPNYGDMFGRWKFLEEIIENRDNGWKEIFWKCECQCDNKTIKLVRYDHLISKGRGWKSESCGCLRKERASDSKWNGYGEISGFYFNNLYQGSIRRNIEFNITLEYIWNLFLEQNRKCALTGDILVFPPKGSLWKEQSKQTASLDRIDSDKGYIPGNVQWLHKDINKMKQCFSNEELLNISKKIVNYYGNK